MKGYSPFVLALGLGTAIVLLAGMSAHNPSSVLGSVTQNADAAFRDGVYQAKIDVEAGRTPFFRTGRWNSEADRASFIAGYQQRYRQLSEALGKLPDWSAAELVGYPDGMIDGMQQRRASQPFQVDQTDKYRNAGKNYTAIQTDSETYRQHYRQAYSDGYWQGYYSLLDQGQLKPMSESWSR